MTKIIINRSKIVDADISGLTSIYFDYYGNYVYGANQVGRLIGIFRSNIIYSDEKFIRWKSLILNTRKFDNTDVYIYIRSSDTADGINYMSWEGPFINHDNDISDYDGKYLQFMAVLINNGVPNQPVYYGTSGYPIIDSIQVSFLSYQNAVYFFSKDFDVGFSPQQFFLTYNATMDNDSLLRFYLNPYGTNNLNDYKIINANKINDFRDISDLSNRMKLMVEMIGTSGVPIQLHEFSLMFSAYGNNAKELNRGTNIEFFSSSSTSSSSSGEYSTSSFSSESSSTSSSSTSSSSESAGNVSTSSSSTQSYSSFSSYSSSSTSSSSSADIYGTGLLYWNYDPHPLEGVYYVGKTGEYTWDGGSYEWDYPSIGANIAIKCKRLVFYHNVWHDGSTYYLNTPTIAAPYQSGTAIPNEHPYVNGYWNYVGYSAKSISSGGSSAASYKLGGNISFSIDPDRLYTNLIDLPGIPIPAGVLHDVVVHCTMYHLEKRGSISGGGIKDANIKMFAKAYYRG